MNKYFKNSILCGEVDFFCLLCEEVFHNEAELDRHIRWEQHRKKLKDISYVYKFKNDFIIKFGNQFYCEVCNCVLSTTLKASLHIQDESHKAKKQNSNQETEKSKSITRKAGNIEILGNILVTENEWNGIYENQCILCDMDTDDVETHLRRNSHVINMISNKVVFINEEAYRTIGEIFYCFTCKEPFSKNLLESHFKKHSDKKKLLNQNITNNGASTSSQTFSAEFKNNMKKMFASDSKKKVTGSPDIVAKLSEFQKEGFNIDFNKSTATCKKCKFSPAFTAQAIEAHIKMHKKAENDSPGFEGQSLPSDIEDDDDWTSDSADGDTESHDSEPESNHSEDKENVNYLNMDHGKIRAELAKFGKPHSIKLVHAGSKGYCTLCDSYISAHIKNFKQHIKGAKHIAHIELKAGRTPQPTAKDYKTKTLRDYIRNIFFVKQMDDFWINRKLCIDKHSFTFLCHLETNGKFDKIKCFLCNEVFPSDKDQSHCERLEHKSKLFNTKVVVSLKREFVREIRDNLYHCGYCNEVYPTWATMQKHLKSFRHLERKDQQIMVADMTHDTYGMHMEDTNTAETDIMWMQLMGNRLF